MVDKSHLVGQVAGCGDRHVQGVDRDGPVTAGTHLVEADVARDAVEPRRELRASVEAVEASIHLDEDLLYHVVGDRDVTEEADGVSVDGRRVLAHEHLERVEIALLRA